MQYVDKTFVKSSKKDVTEDTKSKIPRELAMSGFDQGENALLPKNGDFPIERIEQNVRPQNDPPKNGLKEKPQSGSPMTFGSTLGLQDIAKDRGGSRGIMALLKKGDWTKIMEAHQKYETQLGQALDKRDQDPKTLLSLSKQCGALVDKVEDYIKDKSGLLDTKGQKKEDERFERRKLQLEEQKKKLNRDKNGNDQGLKQKALTLLPRVQEELEQMIIAGPKFVDPVGEQRRSTAMAMLPRLKIELVQLQSGQLPDKGLNDTTLVGGEGSPIGSGALNAPTLNTFQKGEQQFEGVFKKDQGLDVSRRTRGQHLNQTSSHEMTERAVGSSMVDRWLGTNVVAKTDFGIVGKKLGQVMEKANGQTANGREKLLNKNGKPIVDKKTGKEKMSQVKANQKIDYEDPELQRQLYALEWVDFFTGEGDRHGQNLLIDQGKNGTKVTGIDNDMGFTEKDQGVTQGGKDPSKFPQFIDAKLAERIMAKDFTLNNYVKMLAPILPPRSLEVAKARFPKVVEHAMKLIKEGKIINAKGENVLGGEGKTMEWGSEELKKEMLEGQDPSGLLPGFWRQQQREKAQTN